MNIDLKVGGHKWEKQNMVTVFKGRRHYDLMKCSVCGLQGKVYSLGQIDIQFRSAKKAFACKGYKAPEKIKITICRAAGDHFSNLIPNSEHVVIEPPHGYTNDGAGVWVQGVGQPVRVLPEEYVEL